MFIGGAATMAVSWRSWSWDPTVLFGIVIAAWAYTRGLGRLWGRAGVGHGVARWRALCFVGGLATIVVALLSPFDALDSLLFSAHMIQHLLLILVAAPLLVLGAPGVPWLYALPLSSRRALGHWWKRAMAMRAGWQALAHPLVVWSLNVVVLFAWHLPGPYALALRYDAVHGFEHTCFLGVSLLFWWTLLDPAGQRRLGHGAAVLFVFTMGLPMGILGALLTFAPTLWYPTQEVNSALWHLTPLEDQQLAGLLMWIPSGIIYLLLALTLLAAWLRDEEMEMRAHEERTPRRARPPYSPVVALGEED
jgi:putative membrane protein